MTTITLHLPDNAPLAALHAFADQIDCVLRRLPDGSYSAVPRHGNATVVKFPRYRRQFIHTRLQAGPDGDGGPEAA